MPKKVALAIFIVLALGVTGLYLYGVFIGGDAPTDYLFRTLAVVFLCAAGIVRTVTVKGRRPLKFYEDSYKKELEGAFVNSPSDRVRLLEAIRLYNESKYEPAAKMLTELKAKCVSREDFLAVGLFFALNITDAGAEEIALDVYQELIDRGIETSTIYGNIGHIHVRAGRMDDATEALIKAAKLDPKNPYPLQNIAKMYFDRFEFDKAIKWAEKALEINHKVYQASTMLAIIYALREEHELERKYAHMAISSGQDPERLKAAIAHYRVSYEISKGDGDKTGGEDEEKNAENIATDTVAEPADENGENK